MSSDDAVQDAQPQVEGDDQPQGAASGEKKRPRLDLTVGPSERKRGRSVFGMVLGTLNKAKLEDKERNASEAAKKRQLLEQRLQAKLKKEVDSVRRAEEAKKEKTLANRKEEELQLKDSICKHRRIRLPIIANFLLTSEPPQPGVSLPGSPQQESLSSPPKSYPPPLYYLPAILTPDQEATLLKRKTQLTEMAEKEWQAFQEERTAGVEEVKQLRQRAAEEEARNRSERPSGKQRDSGDEQDMAVDEARTDLADQTKPPDEEKHSADHGMEVDDVSRPSYVENKEERKDEQASYDDDAVEY